MTSRQSLFPLTLNSNKSTFWNVLCALRSGQGVSILATWTLLVSFHGRGFGGIREHKHPILHLCGSGLLSRSTYVWPYSVEIRAQEIFLVHSFLRVYDASRP